MKKSVGLCEKTIFVTPQWTYFKHKNNKKIYFCSYTCYKKFEANGKCDNYKKIIENKNKIIEMRNKGFSITSISKYLGITIIALNYYRSRYDEIDNLFKRSDTNENS